MFKRTAEWTKTTWQASASTFCRFPWMVVCALLGTGIALWGIEQPTFPRALLACALGMPLFFLLQTCREEEALKMRRLAEVLGAGLLVTYTALLPSNSDHWTATIWLRFLLLWAGLHFTVAVAPFVGRPLPTAFWQFNWRLFLRFLLATLYAGVLTVGLQLALICIDKLFGVHFDKAYLRVFIVIGGVFHPLFFLAGIPRRIAQLEEYPSYPAGLKAFTQFALAPLVLVYGIILYAYAGKIVLAMHWPQGWVAMPVLILASIGILAALLLHPLRTVPSERWAGWYGRWFFRALTPLSVLLLLSLRLRISQYGVTEERYLGVVAGGWLLATGLLYTVRPHTGIRWIPASLALLCFLSALGPWSAFHVSLRSQLARLDQALEKGGLLQRGLVVPTPVKLSPADYDNLQSLIGYVLEHHGDTPLFKRFANATPMKKPEWAKNSANPRKERLLTWMQVDRAQERFLQANINTSNGLPVEGWKTLHLEKTLTLQRSTTFGNLTLRLEKDRCFASEGVKKEEALPLEPLLERTGERPAQEMYIDWPADHPAFRIYLSALRWDRTAKGIQFEWMRVIVLER